MRYLDDSEAIRASMNDASAFEPVFERYHARIFAYLAGRVGPAEAEDIASEVFVAAFRQRASFHADATSAAPWLYGIAANMARRHFRSMSRRSRAHARLAGHDVVWLDPDSADRVDAQHQAAGIAVELRRLRTKDREVLLLYALAELSYAEIAEALDIPVGTVRSRLSRTRSRLRNLVADKGQSMDRDAALGEVSDE